MTGNERVAIENKITELDLSHGIVIEKKGVWYVCVEVEVPVEPPHINLSHSGSGPCIIEGTFC